MQIEEKHLLEQLQSLRQDEAQILERLNMTRGGIVVIEHLLTLIGTKTIKDLEELTGATIDETLHSGSIE